jgi:glycosyltransferase involved in cell wall biosynthesis
MKIGLSGTFWGMDTTGSGQYLHRLLDALSKQVPPIVCTLFVPTGTTRGTSRTVIQGQVALHTPFDRFQQDLSKLWFEQVAFPRACGQTRVDLAHVPYFAPPRCPTVPTVVTIHDLIPLILPDYRGSPLVQAYMRLVSTAAWHAALILTDSQSSARDIERLLHIPRERVRVIYLAADAIYRPLTPVERQPTLERLGIPPHYMLYLGGFDRRKNVVGLLHAWAQARSHLDGLAMVIAGRLPPQDSAFTPDPRKVAADLGLAEHIYYTGWVAEEDKPALYAGAQAFVFPSYYEGFGLPVLEAISCGTPVVVGQGSSLEEIAGPGGLSVPATDVPALADALVRLAHEPQLRQRMSAEGICHAQRFSWEATAQQTLAAYHDALKGG